MVQETVQKWGPLTLMAANAGIAQAKPQLDVAEQDIDRAMPTNFKGVFHCYTGAVRQMIAQGLPQEVGSVAVSKIVSKPFATLGIYSASEWAVRGLTQAINSHGDGAAQDYRERLRSGDRGYRHVGANRRQPRTGQGGGHATLLCTRIA
ncbi:hypothetical protein P175DRAFT_0344332 [Aspergillus ochraceoroseus IBT 24754]|uniref:Ketoreductase (KR) domain-containing protein n=1 Tax=Aspergillus ochraceoroseus IBT 24754 TaxID=1392256 RepID=A0A2T5LNY0_9EURO|nr:uncharacterized protein P175DRAFT_0344332 [Aspergillus ochraceoroseus IBT 24754]PTU17987.1 hypothetical protein P175DRAFT_0344332 [Aspergillus ochraceoroseus IBT 24754]